MCISVELQDWVVFTPNNMAQEIRPFIQQIRQVGSTQNFHIPEPVM